MLAPPISVTVPAPIATAPITRCVARRWRRNYRRGMDRHCRIYGPGGVDIGSGRVGVVRPRLILEDRSRVAVSIVMPIAVGRCTGRRNGQSGCRENENSHHDILLVVPMQYGHLAT